MSALQQMVLASSIIPAAFVDAVSGSDSNDGLSAAAPKQTLAAGLALLTSGKTLALKRGSVFRETGIDFATANTAITDYGTGNKPRVSGGALVTTWTADATTPLVTDTFESGAVAGYWTGSAGSIDSTNFKNGSKSWRVVNQTVENTSSPNSNYSEVTFYLRVDSGSTASNGNFARIAQFEGTWNGANGAVCGIDKSGGAFRIGATRGGGSITGSTPYTLTANTWYLVRFVVQSNNAGSDRIDVYVDGTLRSSLTGLTLSGASASGVKFGSYAYNATGFTLNFDDVKVYNADPGTASLYYASYSSAVNVLTYNMTLGTLKASKVLCAATGDYFWDTATNRLYLFTTAGNPDSVYTTSGVEVGVRTKILDMGTTSNVSLKNIAFSHHNATSAAVSVNLGATGGVWDGVEFLCNRFTGGFNQSAGAIVRNMVTRDNGNIGLDIDSGANILVEDFTCTNDRYAGVYAGALTPTINNFTFRRGTITCTPALFCPNGLLVDNANTGLIEDVTVTGAQYNGFYTKANTAGAVNITYRRCVSSGIFNGYGFHAHRDTAAAVSVTYDTCSDTGSFSKSLNEGGATVTGTIA